MKIVSVVGLLQGLRIRDAERMRIRDLLFIGFDGPVIIYCLRH